MSNPTTEFVPHAGGSIVSRNVLDGVAPLRWAFREAQVNPVDNGWRFLSAIDDDAYINDPRNMVVVDFNTVVGLEPAVLPLLDLQVGADITLERSAEGRITLIDNNTAEPLEL
ncbi:DUF2185 domain-containing protein [Microbacterium luticocti]|uniref:DUF2185 domain-containing protein n=1 Tax=Microbacterium luticocti TaxID=451764 RepID=UPI00048BE1BC|nr:DUF2185 domain-containing protein [Microbacterium luticocti]